MKEIIKEILGVIVFILIVLFILLVIFPLLPNWLQDWFIFTSWFQG